MTTADVITTKVELTENLIGWLCERGFDWTELVGGLESLTYLPTDQKSLIPGQNLPRRSWNFDPKDPIPTIIIEETRGVIFCRSSFVSAGEEEAHRALAEALKEWASR